MVKRLVTSARAHGAVVPEEAEAEVYGALPPGLRLLDVVELSLDAMQSVVAGYRLAGYPPDVLVSVPKVAANTLDFHRAPELIVLGREAAIEAFDTAQAFPPARTGGDA